MSENKPELDPISIQWKREYGFHDTAGIKDAAGVPIKFTKMPNGFIVFPTGVSYIEQVKEANIRPDDVIVCGYPKTGCHWTWEMLYMIQRRSAKHSVRGKLECFLDMVSLEFPESLPSPRVLNTHVEYQGLPKQALAKKTKLVLTTRNPKDTAVSLYNHHLNLPLVYGYNGKFNDWFPLYLNGTIDYGSFLDYHVTWDKVITENPDHPIFVFNYEDSKEDPVGMVRRLAEFLEVDLSDQLVLDIAKAAGFDSMKKKFEGTPEAGFIRKGAVGDWKNWLTEEQSQAIDDKWGPGLSKTRFNFRYEL